LTLPFSVTDRWGRGKTTARPSPSRHQPYFDLIEIVIYHLVFSDIITTFAAIYMKASRCGCCVIGGGMIGAFQTGTNNTEHIASSRQHGFQQTDLLAIPS